MTEINYTTSETAKLIKNHLKAEFPGVKFSVRKPYYGVINIEFAGTKEMAEKVERIADSYECGSFDGMTDCLNYSRKKVGDLFIDYGTRFIFVRCERTDKAVA
jgi:hypothetical protein